MGSNISKPPRDTPEHTLWRLTKNGNFAEARTRPVPGGTEVRIYVTMTPRNTIEPIDLLWSEVIAEKRKVGEMADQKKKDFEARGWAEEALT